jgi:ribosomal protein L31
MPKKDIHPQYYRDVKVVDIDGNEFTVNSTVVGPIKVEVSYKNHPAYNKDLKIERVVRGRTELYEKKLEKIKQIQKSLKK